MGVRKKYDNETKRHWRKWAWKRIASAASPGWRVVYLIGDSALDHQEAESRGLVGIGVDCISTNVANARSKGAIAVNDRLHRQVISIRPDALLADMLGGLTAKSFNGILYTAMGSGVKFVVWNGLRGMDHPVEHDGLSVVDWSSGRPHRTHVGKHRGKMAVLQVCSMFCLQRDGRLDIERNARQQLLVYQSEVDALCRQMRPSFYSYRSEDSGQWFDSVAFSIGWLNAGHDALSLKETRKNKVSKRRAAAAKAVATKRYGKGARHAG